MPPNNKKIESTAHPKLKLGRPIKFDSLEFNLGKMLGFGGFAAVYKAEIKKPDELRKLNWKAKLIKPDFDFSPTETDIQSRYYFTLMPSVYKNRHILFSELYSWI